MLSNHSIPHRSPSGQRQAGIVLFIALIVLVLMTLAGIALMRSTMTGNLIAGNLAFKQSAINSSDFGVESAVAWLEANNSGTNLFTGKAASGYNALRADPAANQSWDAFWNDSINKGANPPVVTLATDGAGNTVSYTIHRLCNSEGDPLGGNGCDVSPINVSSTTSSKGSGVVGLQVASQVYYRITVRTQGPRNTVSYTQAVVAM